MAYWKVDIAKMIEMVNAGMESSVIAARFGCGKLAVQRARKKLGMNAEIGIRPRTLAQRESTRNYNSGVIRQRLAGSLKNPEYIMPKFKTPVPDAIAERTNVAPLLIDTPGRWLILSDIHVPHHDKAAIEAALKDAEKHKIAGILLNGDIHDSGALSRHLKHSAPVRYKDEIAIGQQLLDHISERFPKARRIYKAGNHEERFDIYVQQHAKEFDGLYNLPDTLKLKDKGYEWVGDCRIIKLGDLNVLHGHEYRGGGGGVSPAQWLSRKARDCAMIGHFHRSTYHKESTVGRYVESYWSIGCLCNLRPEWLPENNWDHSFAYVDLESDGDFFVIPREVLPSGKVR